MRAMVLAALVALGACTTGADKPGLPETEPATPVRIQWCESEDERQFWSDGHCVHIDKLTPRALERVLG